MRTSVGEGLSDGPVWPTSVRMLLAPRPLLWRYWLLSGESGSILILMTAEETAALLCGPPATWSRREMRTQQCLWRREGKGRAQGTHEAVSKPTWNSFYFNDHLHAYVVCSVVDETPELIFTNCVKSRPHIVDWLCFARWGSRVIGAAHLMGI